MSERWDLYDEKRNKTGLTLLRGEPVPTGYFHLVVSAWIINNQGQYLLSQRHPDKEFPYFWECTGGSVLNGESSLTGAIREVKEELGIELNPDSARLLYRTRRDKTQDFYDVWLFHRDMPISQLRLQSTEVINARWVDRETLISMYEKKELHPYIDYIDQSGFPFCGSGADWKSSR